MSPFVVAFLFYYAIKHVALFGSFLIASSRTHFFFRLDCQRCSVCMLELMNSCRTTECLAGRVEIER
eukprot:2151489-Prorocentrum_lima.AAC.1